MENILKFCLMIIDTFAMINVVLIIEVIFGARLETNRKKLLIASVVFLCIECTMETLLDNSYEVMFALVEYLLMLIITFIFAKERKIRTALLTFSSVFVYLQWFYVSDLIEMLFGLDKYKMNINGTITTPAYFVSEFTLFLLLIYLKQRFQKEQFRIKMTKLELTFITIFCIFSPFLTEIFAALESVVTFNAYRMMWVFFVLILNFAVIYAIVHRKKATYYKELSYSYKQEFNKEYHYFKEYKKKNKDMINFRHDWNNHMIIISDLISKGRNDEAQKYFESFPTLHNINKPKKLLTGNEIVDTIFAAKANIITENQIEIGISGSLTRIAAMEPFDICILFSNLIDNALEELVKVRGKRFFYITITESPNMTMIVFKNNMESNLIIDGTTIVSSKTDSQNHGIGLGNVKDIINKYNGDYDIVSENGIFEMKVILPM